MTKSELKQEVLDSSASSDLKEMVCGWIETAYEAGRRAGFLAGQASITKPLDVVSRVMMGENVAGHYKP